MSRKKTVHPPNCEIRDANPSRLSLFVLKQKEVLKEYGFLLGTVLSTESEREGHRRYMRDWQARYREEHREELRTSLREYRRKYKGREDELKAKRAATKHRVWEQNVRREEYRKKRQMVLEKYGFVLGSKPRPGEEEGRRRYHLDVTREWKKRNPEKVAAKQKREAAYKRERAERLFQARMAELEKTDPEAAARKRGIHERQCRLQRMSHEDRVRYNQQKLFDKLKAQAERERVVQEKKARRAEEIAKNKEERRMRLALWAKEQARLARIAAKEREQAERSQRAKDRRATNAARREAERALEEQYRKEREENLKRYLEFKKSRSEGKGVQDEG